MDLFYSPFEFSSLLEKDAVFLGEQFRCFEAYLFLLHLGQAILLFPPFGCNFTIIISSMSAVTPDSRQIRVQRLIPYLTG